jgi:hypothetical protein
MPFKKFHPLLNQPVFFSIPPNMAAVPNRFWKLDGSWKLVIEF